MLSLLHLPIRPTSDKQLSNRPYIKNALVKERRLLKLVPLVVFSHQVRNAAIKKESVMQNSCIYEWNMQEREVTKSIHHHGSEQFDSLATARGQGFRKRVLCPEARCLNRIKQQPIRSIQDNNICQMNHFTGWRDNCPASSYLKINPLVANRSGAT